MPASLGHAHTHHEAKPTNEKHPKPNSKHCSVKQTPFHHGLREDALTTTRGADRGRSNVDQEAIPLKSPQHRQSFRAAAPTSTYSATHPTDRQHHLPGPPSRHTTACTRATMLHDTVILSPSYTVPTTRRPRPPHQLSGPPPRPKSQTASTETCQPSRQPRRTDDTKLSPSALQTRCFAP
jgi:hypothetical protein